MKKEHFNPHALSDEALRESLSCLRRVPNAWPERLDQLEAEEQRRKRLRRGKELAA